jgi:mono/diheme cytochrome c family protein
VRRLALLAVLALVAAGCSDSKPGGDVVSPVPGNQLVTVAAPTVPAAYANGDPVAGKALFTSKGCAACHTLKDAGATGTVGPNLDQLQPTLPAVVHQVIHGGGAMPAFGKTLTAKQIADVSAYVVKATGG